MDRKCALCGKPLDVFNNSGICIECKNGKIEHDGKVENYRNEINAKEFEKYNVLNFLIIIFCVIGVANPIFLLISLILGKNAKKDGYDLFGYKMAKIILVLEIIFILVLILLYFIFPPDVQEIVGDAVNIIKSNI